MKKLALIIMIIVAYSALTGYNYYNPLPQDFLLFPADYMETHSPPPYKLQPPPQRSVPPQNIKLYNQNGELSGMVVHGIYEPPPQNFRVTEKQGPDHPNWHMLPPE